MTQKTDVNVEEKKTVETVQVEDPVTGKKKEKPTNQTFIDLGRRDPVAPGW
jgi:hypothetical protein